MESIFAHMQITTDNEIGEIRRARNIENWKNLGIIPTYITTNNQYKDSAYFSESLNSKMRGVSGCLDTHRKAWEIFLSGKSNWVLITEDDAIPAINLVSEIDKILNDNVLCNMQTPTIFQLGYLNPAELTFKRIIAATIHLIRYRGAIENTYIRHLSFGTHGYLINRNMAHFLLNNLSGSLIPIDNQFISASRNQTFSQVNFYRRVMSLIDQDLIDSSIDLSQTQQSNGANSKSKFLSTLAALADSDSNRLKINNFSQFLI
jgi:GR25 family glycosyltransferase involved in LPS biosynthesis